MSLLLGLYTLVKAKEEKHSRQKLSLIFKESSLQTLFSAKHGQPDALPSNPALSFTAAAHE